MASRFYGADEYHVLINPNNPLVRAVLQRMVLRPDLFIFLINGNRGATAFRSGLADEDIVGLAANLPRILSSTTSAADYRQAVTLFQGARRCILATHSPGCAATRWLTWTWSTTVMP